MFRQLWSCKHTVWLVAIFVPQSALGGPAEDDFHRRASQPGVLRAINFNSVTDVTRFVFPDGRFESSGSGYDTSVRASGNGSLRFTIPSLSGDNSSGSWRINFSDAPYNVQFGENEEFFVQWRQRFDEPMLRNAYAGADGWKTIIIGQGDTAGAPEVGSCTELELVTFNGYQQGYPRLYHSCVSFWGFYEPFGSSDFKMQNAMPAPYCLYSDLTASGCFKFVANEWMTFQIRVKLGPRGTAYSSLERKELTGFTNSTVEMWVAREGLPSTLVISWAGIVLRETKGKKYGKVWLLPYNTRKNPSLAYPVANTWYDELIVSRNRIPDPVGSSVKPNPPGSLVVR